MNAHSIILIHGALGDARQLAPLADALAPQYSSLLIELDGHGSTPCADDGFRVERFAESVRARMASQGIARAHVFGYSLGGYVALHLARYAPECVRSVSTLATKLAWTAEIATRETSRLDPGTIRAKVPRFASALEERHAGAGGWELVLARTASLMRSLGEHPILDTQTLADIQPPVCFMTGDRDTVVTIDETVAAARAVPRGECCILPNTSHPVEQTRITLLNPLLRDFLARVDRL